MKKRHFIITLALGFASFFGAMAVVSPALAATKCGDADTAVIKCDGTGEEALFDLVRQAVRILTGAVFALAVGAVVFGAVLYTTSGDSPEGIKKARTIWMNTVIGLIMFAFMVALTNFLIPGGVFG